MTESAASAAPTTPVVANTLCRNCNTPAPGNYCPECGQETSLHPPSVGEFVNHFLGNYVAVKSTLGQTLWALISKPGQLTVDYLAGRKRRYVLPFKLYLTVSIVTLLLISLFANLNSGNSSVEAVKLDAKPNGTLMNIGSAQIRFDDGKFVCTGMPDRACAHLRKKFDHSRSELQAMFSDVPQRMLKFWGYAMFVLIPLFALMLHLIYRNRRLVYGEHLVFALHLHTFWLLDICLLVLLPDVVPGVFAFILTLAIPTYALLAMRRVYGGRWFPRLLRAALLSALYFFAMSFMLAVVALIAVIA